MVLVVKVRPTSAVAVSTMGDSPLTVMVSVTAATVEIEVDGSFETDGQRDAVANHRLEAGKLRRDLVRPGGQERRFDTSPARR